KPKTYWSRNKGQIPGRALLVVTVGEFASYRWRIVRAKRTYRLIVPSGKVSKVVREVHVELEHASQRRSEAAVRQRFSWPKLHDDVVRNCANRNICAQTEFLTVAPRAPLQTVAKVGPNYRAAIDVMGPLPTSRRGNKYILVIVDYFTKWCEAFPMPNQEVSTITPLFVNECTLTKALRLKVAS
ncbi:uncharacterized protein DEA37_0010397, partial [Paragonimus westermani]